MPGEPVIQPLPNYAHCECLFGKKVPIFMSYHESNWRRVRVLTEDIYVSGERISKRYIFRGGGCKTYSPDGGGGGLEFNTSV